MTNPLTLWADAYWETYLKGRPQFLPSLFTHLCEYHASHGGHFDVVNDVGAGVGQFSVELARRFTSVIVTEPSEGSLNFARKYLASADTDGSKYRFVHAKVDAEI